MNIKKYIFVLLTLLYFDLIFNLFVYDSYLLSSAINIFMFDLIVAAFICLITSFFSEKINRIITYFIYFILWFWYGFNCIFYKVLLTPFSLALFRQTDQTLKFGKNIIISILKNMHIVVLFILPLLILIIFHKKKFYEKSNKRYVLSYIFIFIISIGLYIGNIFIQNNGV